MNDVRWSDARLRKYLEDEGNLGWLDDGASREAERDAFRQEIRAAIVPIVQAKLLERIGALTDPEGLAIIVSELVTNLNWRGWLRIWLTVSTDPWTFLADWSTDEIAKAYRGTAGKKRPSKKTLQEIERANQ